MEFLVPAGAAPACSSETIADKSRGFGARHDGVRRGLATDPGLDAIKSLYDASGGGKDQFSFIDVGLNPEVKLPTNTGRIGWVARC